MKYYRAPITGLRLVHQWKFSHKNIGLQVFKTDIISQQNTGFSLISNSNTFRAFLLFPSISNIPVPQLDTNFPCFRDFTLEFHW